MYIAAKNVVKDIEGVTLVNLTENQGSCLHDYQLTTADLKKLETADVLIINGGGMESFLEEIVEAYPNLAILDASLGMETKEENAHYWVDPDRYKIQLSNIEKGLAAMDSAHKKAYEENLAAYVAKVEKEKEKFFSALESFPKENVVLFSDAFYYLAERLGFSISYHIELEEDTALNTGEIAEIIDLIKEENVGLLFSEEAFLEGIPQSISRETLVPVCVVDTLVTGSGEEDAYLVGMGKNRQAILDCLSSLYDTNGK
jgi:zinc transport system substrate-binding protein